MNKVDRRLQASLKEYGDSIAARDQLGQILHGNQAHPLVESKRKKSRTVAMLASVAIVLVLLGALYVFGLTSSSDETATQSAATIEPGTIETPVSASQQPEVPTESTTAIVTESVPSTDRSPEAQGTPDPQTLSGEWTSIGATGPAATELDGPVDLHLEFFTIQLEPALTLSEGRCPVLTGTWSAEDPNLGVLVEIDIPDLECDDLGTVPLASSVIRCLLDGCPAQLVGQDLELRLAGGQIVRFGR